MANHKSALKRLRQNIRLRAHNRDARSAVRTALKATRQAIAVGDREAALAAFKKAEVVVQKAAGHGLYHPKTASRTVSRLARAVNALQ